jgi:site-specific DNA-methyltransferase (adenine-specific)
MKMVSLGSDSMGRSPGSVRDAIVRYLSEKQDDASLEDIKKAVTAQLGDVSPSSVRSYLNLNVPGIFVRTGRGRYRLQQKS